MELGIVGKPNVGKSTFFSAATLVQTEIASYPFTTIEPNRGVGFVRAQCPHVELGVQCVPNNSKCINGTRYIPIDIIDVAGLVPDAHKGRGLGNQFLDDLRQAGALIHVVDASGGTTFEGNICRIGEHDPLEDVAFLETEIAQWIKSILDRGWTKIARQLEMGDAKIEELLHQRLTGLGITETQVRQVLRTASASDTFAIAKELQKISKPMVIAANKADIAPKENIQRLRALENNGKYIVIPTFAEGELALRRAANAGLIRYMAGNKNFEILDSQKLTSKQLTALEKIRAVMMELGSTGVQECLEAAVYRLLDMLVAYPVEDETHFTDKENRVLPDAHLLKRGSTARDLAFKVHTELGNNFIRAINARTKRTLGQDYQLQNNDIIKIVAR